MPEFCKRQRYRHAAGFSMTEILVVMIIISFAATTALLAYANYRKGASLQSSAQKIATAMTAAKTHSIANNRPTRLILDLERDIFWVDELNSSMVVTRAKFIPPEPMADFVIIDSVRVQSTNFNSGQAEVIFQPDGTNPLVTVTLRRQYDDPSIDENFYYVQLYPSTNEARIQANRRPNTTRR